MLLSPRVFYLTKIRIILCWSYPFAVENDSFTASVVRFGYTQLLQNLRLCILWYIALRRLLPRHFGMLLIEAQSIIDVIHIYVS